MVNLYLILFSPTVDRDLFIKAAENAQLINHWFYAFPNSVFVKSNADARALSRLVDSDFGKKIHFITAITEDYYGRMSEDLWKGFPATKYL